MDFKEKLVQYAESIPQFGSSLIELKTNAPVSDDEVKAVQDALGFSLDERFLSYFRSTNGWRLRWVNKEELSPSDAEALMKTYKESGGCWGEIIVPPLAELFSDEMQGYIGEGFANHTWSFLGGEYNDEVFRNNLRFLYDPRGDGYNFVCLFADKTYADPVLIWAHDHGADLDGAHPIRARTYFELQLFKLGFDVEIFFNPKGFGGDHDLIDIDLDEFPNEPFTLLDPNEARGQYTMDSLLYLSHLAGRTLDDPVTEKPTRRLERMFAPKPRTKMAKAIALAESWDLFDSETGDESFKTFFKNKHGESWNDCEASLQIWPPYGKKSPQASLTWTDAFPMENVEKITAGLLEFGMTLKPGSD